MAVTSLQMCVSASGYYAESAVAAVYGFITHDVSGTRGCWSPLIARRDGRGRRCAGDPPTGRDVSEGCIAVLRALEWATVCRPDGYRNISRYCAYYDIFEGWRKTLGDVHVRRGHTASFSSCTSIRNRV